MSNDDAISKQTSFRVTAGIFVAFFLISLGLLLSGCSTPNLNPGYQPEEHDAVIVLGLEGASGIRILKGWNAGQIWHSTPGFRNRPKVFPDDGFIVLRLDGTHGEQSYAVATVWLTNGNMVSAQWQMSCPTFPAVAGTVTYVGNLCINANWGNVTWSNRWDPRNAKQYMEKNYPGLAPQLHFRPFESRRQGFW